MRVKHRDFGMNVQAALEQARLTKATFDACDAEMEATFPAEVRAGLSQRGHQIKLLEPFSFQSDKARQWFATAAAS